MSDLIVFRTDDSKKQFIWEELKAGRLRQGWGPPGSSLIGDQGVLTEETWTERYIYAAQHSWGHSASDAEAQRRYRILRNLTLMRAGCVVLVPKMPQRSEFATVTVNEGYRYEIHPNYPNDYGHVIGVDPASIRTFGYEAGYDSRVVHKKLRGYQAAVNNVFDPEFKQAVLTLVKRGVDPGGISAPLDLISDLRDPLLAQFLARIRNMPPRDLEKLVAKAFESGGYQRIRFNRFDKKGGDADVVMSFRLPIVSDLAGGSLTVFIQVKNKYGSDANDVVGVRQLALIAEDQPQSLKILVSTVDEFGEECIQLAADEKVILVNGLQIADLLARHA